MLAELFAVLGLMIIFAASPKGMQMDSPLSGAMLRLAITPKPISAIAVPHREYTPYRSINQPSIGVTSGTETDIEVAVNVKVGAQAFGRVHVFGWRGGQTGPTRHPPGVRCEIV